MTAEAADANLLSIRDLRVAFRSANGLRPAVVGANVAIRRGETLALVGESGSGKSVTALSILRLLPERSAVTTGRIEFEGQDLLAASARRIRSVRGREIAMIFQEPMSSLNPVLRVGRQVAESMEYHLGIGRRAAERRAVDLFRDVGIENAHHRSEDYPHQFSGGMRQRVMIAMALACDPKLIIADEPTTALDVSIQAQVLELLKDLTSRRGVALLLITHNLGIVGQYADTVQVMYAGRTAEIGRVTELLGRPAHPYTAGLMGSIPALGGIAVRRLTPIPGSPPEIAPTGEACPFVPRCHLAEARCQSTPPFQPITLTHFSRCWRADEVRAAVGASEADSTTTAAHGEPLLAVSELVVTYRTSVGLLGRPRLHAALRGVGIDLWAGETLGIVGESGSGKSTLAQCLVGLVKPDHGVVKFRGRSVHVDRKALSDVRRQVQMVFQDPYDSLDPRMRVGDIVAEPLAVHGIAHGAAARARVRRLLDRVGLPVSAERRFPHEFSGGQRQRVAIARAIALEPAVIVCDEPVSALDVSIQAQILTLLKDLQEDLGLSYIFISHDLAVVRHMADRISVMYLGRIVETGPREEVLQHAKHPYTRALIAAVPDLSVAAQPRAIRGEISEAAITLDGCSFRSRCLYATAECALTDPALALVGEDHFAACLHSADLPIDVVPGPRIAVSSGLH